ncbi:hypothetical protein C923_05095 [Plasmodium falciparum UGT5.1]|uniref:Erythrocyte membrane protein 1, PfEMP1 n=1 Tax=Plasmodium falciparum UGT5.1 TaxID=1237627 RepID=W7JHR1_PLAFA|nr:hypothetical protein C923_05095 [Plasmodium falciparum UGT5.1]
MARGRGGEEDPIEHNKDAKHLLDSIGKKVYKEVHKKAVDYRKYLKGDLKSAAFKDGNNNVTDACHLIYEYDTNVTGGFDTNNPCANRLDVRFSDKYGGQCTNSKIKGNEEKDVKDIGACAPFRRLFLCDHHLSYMEAGKINNTHNLLLEVLLAAKYEGQSLVKKYNEYKERHKDLPSDICTILARSFADIGDIIRGKDLFLGYNEKDQEEKKQLQENLKKIFKEIYDNLMEDLIKDPTKMAEAQERYNGDKENFFQLREDWWDANRAKVWEAITCKAEQNDKYFRDACSEGTTSTQGKCHCITGDVPTYFDYVPQYLRWFEEWAEDFCRLRKHKLQNAIKNCGGKDGRDKYCDRNGYDCTRTIRGKKILVSDQECANCYVGCTDFVPWIKNQKQEFEKQKEKYDKEIKQKDQRTITTTHGTINNTYAKEFYDKLRKHYPSVDEFIKKLNEENICTDELILLNEKVSPVNFTNGHSNKTFSHTEYCDTCPWCAKKIKNKQGKWTNEQYDDCPNEQSTPVDLSKTTNINLLSTNIAEHNILEKYKNFCGKGEKSANGKNGNQIVTWQCYYDDSNEDGGKNDNCILGEWKNFTQNKTIKPYELFFSHWIKRMLEDSIKWREQFNNCINNENATKCIKWCKTPCECYKKWVKRMETEWGDIKKHFHKEKNHIDNHHFTTLEWFLELQFLPSIEEAYGNDEAIDKIEELLEERRTHADSELNDEEKKDIIDYLLEHEGKDAEKCTTTHTDEEACTEEEKIHNNPCSEHVNKPTASVKDIARKMKGHARKLLRNRGGRSALKANASQGNYSRGGKADDFKGGKLCTINDQHSNDTRRDSTGPCHGKDGNQGGDRMKIGTPWSNIVEKNKTSYKEVYLPPRREHMCTSNLEHLITDSQGLSESKLASNSLLGDVLLAAKKEGDFIVEKLGGNDNSAICRSMKYSFADLGDIIRGRDMWDLDEGSKKMEKNLVTIFEKIKDNLPQDIQGKYKGDSKHLNLRSDWWEANRYQVWNAMKCATLRDEKIPCPGIPLDDYIPQRLRWMTEWAEWFCKEQYSLYDELETQCGGCMSKNKGKGGKGCTSGDSAVCKQCKAACNTYGNKIKEWQKQWETISYKYLMLYLQTQIAAANGGLNTSVGAVNNEDKPVVAFLQQLLPPKSVKPGAPTPTLTSPYFTPAGYIHQEMGQNVGCNIQTQFCEKKKGGKEKNEKYVFKDKQHDQDTPCNCDKPPKKDACTTVNSLLQNRSATDDIEGCRQKDDGKIPYPRWTCEIDKFQEGHAGACMPPRRQKLCLYYIAHESQTQNIKTDDNLKDAFIKTAAAETFFAWHYYNSKNANAQEQLKAGKIPPDFLRSMFYTYGDYRDICLDTDISVKTARSDITKAKDKIGKVFSNSDDKSPDGLTREDWWNTYAEDIWKGMVCGLSHHIKNGNKEQLRKNLTDNNKYTKISSKLEDFASRPQFLRWFTEWGEEFCRERDTLEKNVEESCKDAQCNIDGTRTNKTECENACKNYTTYIKDKKSEYNEQKSKFDAEKIKGNGLYVNYKDKEAHDYLKEKCLDGSCNCMEKVKDTSDYWENYKKTYDNTTLQKKCECELPPKDACTIVKDLFEDNSEKKKYFDQACSLKYEKGKEKYTQWKCINDTTSSPSGKETTSSTSTCIPPRRQKLYVKPIESLGGTSTVDLRTAFIQSAAVETFFLWHRYKEEKKREEKERKERQDGLYTLSSDHSDAEQKQLETGDIPEEFLHEMFYTFGDYKDILFGYNIGSLKDMGEIEKKLKNVFRNTEKSTGGKTSNDTTRDHWWNEYGKDIWYGMLCALTYDTDTKQLKQDVHDNLIKKTNNKYDYRKVKISSIPINSGNKSDTTLLQFTERPTFFRWLEEWGEEFCRKRTDRLAQIKHECRGKYNNKHCDADGHDCKLTSPEKNKNLSDLDCPGCQKECRIYNEWIEKKEKQFYKQQKKYEKLISTSNKETYKEFYKNLHSKGYTSINLFLESLNRCKNGHDNNHQTYKIYFNKPDDTFSTSEYCETCSSYGVTCNRNYSCKKNTEKEWNKRNDLPNIPKKKNGITTNIDMIVNDSIGRHFDAHIRDFCNNCTLFKRTTDLNWECQYLNGIDQCKIKNGVKSRFFGETIAFRMLFQRWLRYFVQDYNNAKENIKACIKKEDVKSNKCIIGCKDKCECVEKWLKKKEEEWEKIKAHYDQQKEYYVYSIPHWVMSYFQQLPFDDYKKAQEVVENESDRYKLWGCTGKNLENGNEKNCNKGDFISNLIDKLQKKIDNCKTKHETSGNPQPTCVEIPPLDEEPPLDDDTTDKQSPDICKDVGDTKEPETDSEKLCDSKKQPKCNNLENDLRSTCKPKVKLIGLEARNLIAGIKSNIYISPRVQQLCLEPLQELAKSNAGATDKSKLIKAFTKCAYNEGKGLYEYYSKNKNELVKNVSTLSDKDVETYTLEAMKRSYADYGNIVKDDMLWNYDNSYDINEIIFDIATQHSKSQNTHSSDYETKERQNLWELIKTHVWKAMICGYKDAVRGDITSLPNGVDLCTLPSIDKDDQFLRWFEEWGQNFCIRREQEIKRLNEKCHNLICNSTNEGEKQECKILCDNYKEFLKSYANQFKKQSIVYDELKKSIPELRNKTALWFLKEKCKSKFSCFEKNDQIEVSKIFEYFSDDVKDECVCKEDKSLPDDKVNDLDKCPTEKKNNICNTYKKRRMCTYSNNRNSLEYWYGKDMLIPPRRRKICLRNITGYTFYKTNDGKNKFKNALLSAAMSEASFLCNNYEDKREALQAIKYTFADIGDIIKGKDMVDDTAYKKIKVKLENVLEKTGNDPIATEKWWDQNKKHVWNAMLCGYKEAGGKIESDDCNIPSEENTDQFLRWLIEWGKQVCKEKKELKASVYKKCANKDRKVDESCNYAASSYNNWNKIVKHAYDGLNKKYENFKLSQSGSTLTQKDADEYIKEKCSECQCSFEDIEETFKKNSETNDEVLDVIINKSHIPPHLEDIFNRYNGPYLRCPDSKLCIPYKNIPCFGNEHDDDGDWNSSLVRYNKTTNWGVLLPPRRIHLCLRIYPEKFVYLRNDIKHFKNFICSSAFAEAKRLKKVYKDDNDKLLQAMKYSFADIGSVVKGNDMMESPTSKYMDKLFTSNKYSGINRETWWNENKYHVWESMLCGYREAQGDTKKSENCRFPDIERVPQFLRWFQEWTKIFCTKRNELYDKMVSACENAQCDNKIGNVNVSDCMKACEKYKYYVLSKKKEYDIQKNKYDAAFKRKNDNKEAHDYFKDKCKDGQCACLYEKFNSDNNWENPYQSINDSKLKDKCKDGQCACLYEKFNSDNNWENPYQSINDSKLKGKCDCQKTVPPPLVPPSPPPKPDELPIPADEPFNRDILEKTIPFGIAFALGSIAFLFLKKKTQSPVDLFSVINIPKSDYDIPTLKSKNRYIPYKSGPYKGKTYIYMEGDSDEDKYAFMSDTTDVTSSESEYEELDINDIYVPGSPKYKTLIEVVLEPSGNNTTASGKNTPSDTQNDIQNDGIPSNKITDNEWNTLKHDFISNMLQNQPNDVPNDYKSGNSSTNTNITTTSHHNVEEKPFIMSIHDRNLLSGEEYSYNVNMSTNSMDDIPINRDNNDVYSGIDLINDTLSGNHNVDIYDELLKRKENELFGTNHPKHTTINRVAKPARDDPIHNQLELFHKWLDRHRDMCEKLKNDNERLAKLKEQWENETHSGNTHPSDSNKTLNTDVSIQIDMNNPKTTNEFTYVDRSGQTI